MTTRVRALWGATAVALGLSVYACSGREDAAPPDTAAAAQPKAPDVPALDACALLTQAEAEEALGKPVRTPVRADTAPIFACSYVTPDGLDNVSLTVTVHSDARQAHDVFVMALALNKYEEIAGLGDRAYEAALSDVKVLSGRYEVGLDVAQSIEKDAQVEKATDLVRKVLARLPQ